MLIDGARTDGAAARQADLRLAETRQRRTKHQNRSAHRPNQFVRGAGIVDRTAVDFKFADIVGQNARAHALKQLLRGCDICQHRDVFRRNVPDVSKPAHISGNAAFSRPRPLFPR